MSIEVEYRSDLQDFETEARAPEPDASIRINDPQPILEGARARGVVDAYELIGQAALRLDGAGGVLHVGERARMLMGEGLLLNGGHLVGKSQAANRMIANQVALALKGKEIGPCGRVAGPGGGQISVRVVPFRPGQGNPAQLLKAVVLLDRIS